VLPGSTSHTFVADVESKAFVVVEAELDAMLIALSMAEKGKGLAGAIALGSLAHKPDAATCDLLSCAMSVLVALDFEPPAAVVRKQDEGDEAFAKRTHEREHRVSNLRRVYGWWPEQYPRAKRWPVPVGKDPGDAFTAGCDIALWVRSGLPPVMLLEPIATPPVTAPLGCSSSDVSATSGVGVDLGSSPRGVEQLAHHLAAHGITLHRTSPGGLLLPVAGGSTPPSAMDEIIFLIPDDLAAWLKGLDLDEVTADMLGGGRG